MNVILLKDVEKLGLRGEVVNVARGYARNFLLPRNLAEVATEGRVKEVKRIDAQKALHEARSTEQANEIAETLGKLVLRFDVKSGPTGSLFGSVTTTDIADEIWRIRKIRVDRRKIGVDNIKRIGRYTVPIELFEGISAEVKLMVVPEGGGRPRGACAPPCKSSPLGRPPRGPRLRPPLRQPRRPAGSTRATGSSSKTVSCSTRPPWSRSRRTPPARSRMSS